MLLLAACERMESTRGDSPQVAAAKTAVTRKLGTNDGAEFRDIVQFSDGVVCGEFNAKRKFSDSEFGFRKFIYNAPDPEKIVIDNGDLTPQAIDFWCSEQPDKKLRMLTASVAELTHACQAAGGKSTEFRCQLAATQKQALDELQAAASRTPSAAASAPGQAQAPGNPASATVAVAAVPAASSAAPSTPSGAAAPVPADVEAVLRTWRERWEAGDVDGYLRLYEATFTGGAKSRAAWEQQRRQKMANVRPSIGVEGLQAVRVTPHEVELRFVQIYVAKQHRDRGNKSMVFQRSPQGWLIADERWSALR